MSAFVHNNNEEEEEAEKSKLVVKATLASIESLTFPSVQEVVILADYGCKMCRDRVADIISKFNGDMESMEMMIMEKKVILTFAGRCSKAVKTHGKKLEGFATYKNIIHKISNVFLYSNA